MTHWRSYRPLPIEIALVLVIAALGLCAVSWVVLS